MATIHCKAKFYELWEAGVLGNRTRIWRDPFEAMDWAQPLDLRRHGYVRGTWPEIGFREIRRAGSAGAGKWQRVPWSLVGITAEQWQSEGRNFIMDDGVPDNFKTIQGEVVRTERGLEGFIDLTGDMPMRPAMAAGRMKSFGYLQTKLLLDRYMDANSRDDLDALLDQYPDHVIEFSCFSVNVGVMARRNTMFWEVRLY